MAGKIGKMIAALALAVAVFIVANGAVSLLWGYNPEKIEKVALIGEKYEQKISGQKIKVLTFNTCGGYLGAESSLKKEGGTGGRASTDNVLKNSRGISELAALSNADAVLLQGVDTDSYRSRYVDECSYHLLNGRFGGAYALNYKARSTSFLPPYKKINSGLLTMSKKQISSAERISLPKSSISGLKPRHCMLVCKFEIENSSKKLVVINFEVDAYASLETKKEQTKAVVDYAKGEAEKGNYVIAGGSFYRSFDQTRTRYPLTDRLRWTPEELSQSEIPENLTLCYDPTVATARILSSPFDPQSEEKQLYVADGYILSKNLDVNMIASVDQEFRYSAHNPVLLTVTLK